MSDVDDDARVIILDDVSAQVIPSPPQSPIDATVTTTVTSYTVTTQVEA